MQISKLFSVILQVFEMQMVLPNRKCAQVPGELEAPVIQPDSVSEKSVSGKKK